MLSDEWNALGREGIHKQGFSWNRCFRQTHQSPLIGEFGNTQTRHRVSRTFNIWWKTIGAIERVSLKRNEEMKHCQRHNGPEGWVLVTKVTSLGHITRSWIFHKSWSNFIFRISTKHQQNLNQASAFRLNLTSKSSESRLRFNFITSTKN